jgi:hypothetical protein
MVTWVRILPLPIKQKTQTNATHSFGFFALSEESEQNGLLACRIRRTLPEHGRQWRASAAVLSESAD